MFPMLNVPCGSSSGNRTRVSPEGAMTSPEVLSAGRSKDNKVNGTGSRSSEIDRAAVERCVSYFREAFGCRALNSATVTLAATLFHSALAGGDVTFVKGVLEGLASDDLKAFVLSTPVDYAQKSKPVAPNCGFRNQDEFVRRAERSEVYKWQNPLQSIEVARKQQFLAEVDIQCKADTNLELPLALACWSGNESLVSTVISEGGSFDQLDSKENNILHCLVLLSVDSPSVAVRMYKLLLATANEEFKRYLVLAKNADGFRPLELAASRCLPEMTQAIIQTEGVYRFVYKDVGIFRHTLYDVSAYEGKELGDRKACILRAFAWCTEQQLIHLDSHCLLSAEPFKTWFEEKYEMYKKAIYLNLGYWLLYLFIYGYGLSYVMNTHELPPVWTLVLLLLFGTAVIVSEVTVCIGKWRQGDSPCQRFERLRGDSAVRGSRYRIFHTLFALCTCFTAALQLSELHCNFKSHFLVMMHVVNIFCATMSMMFFTQVSTKTGHYITIINKMAGDTVVFMSIMLWVFFPFAASFYIVHLKPSCEHLAHHHNGSDPGRSTFTNFPKGLYETLILNLGIAAPRKFFFEDAYEPLIAVGIYLSGLLWIGIIMMNLLIAIMNQRVLEISQHKRTVLTLQKLSISIYIEEFLDRYTSTLTFVQWLSGGRLVRRRKSFVSNEDGSMVFLHTVGKVVTSAECRGREHTQPSGSRLTETTL